MSKILNELPVGERVGIAFPAAWTPLRGRLDARGRRDPLLLHRDFGPVRRSGPAGVPDRAVEYGAEVARLVDCREVLVEEAWPPRVRRFHIRSAGQTYFNTTPLGRAVTGTLLVRAMRETRS